MARAKGDVSDFWVRKLQDNKAQFGLDTPEKLERAITLARAYRLNQYIPFWPSILQFAIRSLSLPEYFVEEVLIAGERRASKTTGLLINDLLDTLTEDFSAVWFRQTENELLKDKGVLDTLRKWLEPFPEWTFNRERLEFRNSLSNATIIGSFLRQPGDETPHLGFQYDAINIEELTRYPWDENWNPYFDLWTSLTANIGHPVKPRMRSSSNPGGTNEGWVIERFRSPDAKKILIPGAESYMLVQRFGEPNGEGDTAYVHARTSDNPSQDAQKYATRMRRRVDAVTYAQMVEGEWGVAAKGDMFDINLIKRVPTVPMLVMQRRRGWDKAYTQGGKRDRTAGVRMSRLAPGVALQLWGPDFAKVEFVVEHVIAGRWASELRENNIDAIAGGGLVTLDNGGKMNWTGDGVGTFITVEKERSGGKESAEITVARLIRAGYVADYDNVNGDKASRAHQFAAAVNNGMVAIVDNRTWDVVDYLNELRSFPEGQLDDQVDGSRIAFDKLVLTQPSAPPVAGPPRFTNEQRNLVNRY